MATSVEVLGIVLFRGIAWRTGCDGFGDTIGDLADLKQRRNLNLDSPKLPCLIEGCDELLKILVHGRTEPMPKPEPKPKAAHFAETRDWPGYFDAVSGNPPRDTLLGALDLFETEGMDDDECGFAIDLGCGEGRDTEEMLGRGWRVLAIDGHPDALDRLRDREGLIHAERLTLQLAGFEEVDLPTCRLLNASFSLPFCKPESFEELWTRIVAAVEPSGRFCGQLFGDRDDWAELADRSHHTRDDVERLLEPFDVEKLDEDENDGTTTENKPKHWHVFHIIARKK